MELLDRYLQGVKKHLPWKGQDDILAELRANLEAQLEDKEAELGRPLTTSEAEAWLKQIGPPMQVAARYQSQQYLIGPAVFPTYWFVLRTAFLWTFAIYSIVSVVQIFSAEVPSATAVLDAVLRLPAIFMTTAAWVTLAFAGLEFVVTHYPTKWPLAPGSSSAGYSPDWSPGSLPPLEKQGVPGMKHRTFAHAAAEVIFGALLLAWLLLIPQHPAVLLGPGAAYLHVSPFALSRVWALFYWCVVALNALQLTWRCLDLWRGSWQQPPPWQQIAMKLLGIIPLLSLFTVPDHAWVLLKHPAVDQARYGETLSTINQGIYRMLLFICAITVLQLLWDVGQMTQDLYRKRVAAM